MAIRTIDDSILQGIAEAIQAKDGGGKMHDTEMRGRIEAISTGEEILFSNNGQAYAKNIELSDNVISLASNAYYECTLLKSVDLKNVTEIGISAFEKCYSLSTIDLSNVITIRSRSFHSCVALKQADCRNLISLEAAGFLYNSSLKYVDCRKVNSIGSAAFVGCSSLVLIDCTSRETPPTLSSTNSLPADINFKVVFKDAAVKAAVQAATNWSSHATRIYTIPEVEAETGMTYDAYYYQLFGHARNEVAV